MKIENTIHQYKMLCRVNLHVHGKTIQRQCPTISKRKADYTAPSTAETLRMLNGLSNTSTQTDTV